MAYSILARNGCEFEVAIREVVVGFWSASSVSPTIGDDIIAG